MSDISLCERGPEGRNVATQLRIYTMKPGKLEDWIALFRRGVSGLRAAQGFEIDAWSAPSSNQFVWIVRYEGSIAEFDAADAAYYELPEHKPLHEEALGYLERGESWFLEAV
jgi:hypothetical protein